MCVEFNHQAPPINNLCVSFLSSSHFRSHSGQRSVSINTKHAGVYMRVCEVKGICPALFNSNKSVSDKKKQKTAV